VRLVFKDRPLAGHLRARSAHEAARCAGAAGKYWEYHDLLFEKQPAFARADLLRYAGAIGLDTREFARCLDEKRFAADVEADVRQAVALGVMRTPTLLVNGRWIEGAPSLEEFCAIVQRLLEERR